jgi:hypothetical protein
MYRFNPPMEVMAFLLVIKWPGHEAVHLPSSNSKDDNGKM